MDVLLLMPAQRSVQIKFQFLLSSSLIDYISSSMPSSKISSQLYQSPIGAYFFSFKIYYKFQRLFVLLQKFQRSQMAYFYFCCNFLRIIYFFIGNIGRIPYQKHITEINAPKKGPTMKIQVWQKISQVLYLQQYANSKPIPKAGLTPFCLELQVRAIKQQIGRTTQNQRLCQRQVILFSVTNCTIKVRTNVPSEFVAIPQICFFQGKKVVIGACLMSFKYKAISAPTIPPRIWHIIYSKAILSGYRSVFRKILKKATAGLKSPPENCRLYDITIVIESEKSKKKYTNLGSGSFVYALLFTILKVQQVKITVPKNSNNMITTMCKYRLRTICFLFVIQLLIILIIMQFQNTFGFWKIYEIKCSIDDGQLIHQLSSKSKIIEIKKNEIIVTFKDRLNE